MQVFGSFNAKFSKNNSTETKINRQFGDGAYDTYTSSVKDVLNNFKHGKPVGSFETGEIRNFSSINERLFEAELLKQAMLDGESIMSYDIETLGTMDSESFAVTEFFSNEKNYTTKEISPVIDINMGVNEKRKEKLLGDVRRGFDGEMNESAKVTLLRLPFIYSDNEIKSNVEANRTSARIGLENLTKRDIRYGDESLTNALLKASEEIAKRKNNITIGYNIKQFDNEVRKRMLKEHGLNIDALTTNYEIDIYELITAAFDTEIHDMYERNGMGDINGKFRVENLAKLFDVDAGTSHIAADDTATVFKILEAEFDFDGNGEKQNVLDRIISNIQNKVNNANRTTNNSNVLYKSVNSTPTVENFSFNKSTSPNGTLTNNYVNKHLDFMLDTYSGKPMTYRDRSSARGVFYQAGEMKVIPKSKLNKETLDALGEGVEEAYVLPLHVYEDNGFGHTSYIIRRSKQEIEDTLSNNYVAYNLFDNVNEVKSNRAISKNMAKMQQEVYFNDLVRRNFDAMFEVNSQKDFNYAKRMYEAYNEANKAYAELKGDGSYLDAKQVKELVTFGEIEVNGHSLSIDEYIPSLKRTIKDEATGKFVKGDVVTEWARDFGYMYNYLRDTNDVISPIIDQIESSVTYDNALVRSFMKTTSDSEKYAVLNRIKKETLANSYNDIMGAVMQISGEDKELIFRNVIDNANLNYYNYADIFVDGSNKAINITTLDKTIESLSKTVNKYGFTARNEAARKNLATSRLIGITRNLNERGIVSKELVEEVSKSLDPFTSTKAVANALFNYASEIKKDIPEEKILRDMLDGLFNENSGIDKEFIEAFSKLRSGIPTNRAFFGINVNGKSFNKFVEDNAEKLAETMNIDNMVDGVFEKNFRKLNDSFNLSMKQEDLVAYMHKKTIDEKIKTLPDNFVGYLKRELGYKDKEIKAIADMLYHYKDPKETAKDFVGISDAQRMARGDVGSGYISRGYGVSFVSGEKKGQKTHGFLIYRPEDAERVINAYSRGEISSKAVYQPLPTVTQAYGKRYIKQGNSHKMIVDSVRAFSNDSLLSPESIYLKESNTIIDVLNSFGMIKDSVDIAIDAGNYEEASRLLNRQYTKIIGNEIGTTAFKRINDKKVFVPSINDLVQYTKNSGYMALLPALYNENEDVRRTLNDLFGEDDIRNEFNKIENSKKNLDDLKLRSDIDEWYHKNLFMGENLADKMLDLKVRTIDGKTKDLLDMHSKEVLRNATERAKAGSGLVKDHMAGKYNGLISLDNFVEFDPYSEYDSPVRPLYNQRLGMKSIVYEELLQNAKENGIDDIVGYLQNKRIYLGGMVRTRKMDSMYISAAETQGTPLYEGFSAKVSQMPSAAYYELVNDIDAVAFRDEFVMKTGKKITMDDVNYILRSYQNNGATNEQHSILRPSIAKYAAPKPDTISVKLEGVEAGNFNIGQIIDSSTVTGIFRKDNELRNINYKGVKGKVVDIDVESNMLQVEPLKRTFNEIKFNIGDEKSVSTPILGKNQMQFEFSEFLYDKLFGKDVALVGHFGYGGHKAAGNVLQGQFDSVVEMLNLYGNKDDFKFFKEAINQSKLGWNLDFKLDKRTGIMHPIKDTSRATGNAFEMLDSALQTFFDATSNRILKGAILKELSDNKIGNKFRTTMRFADLNESMQSAEDELGRGIKDTVRKRQNIGTYVVDGFRNINEYNELERIVQPIIDMNLETIQSLPQFRDAFVDMGNLYNTSSLISGNGINAKILEKDFSQIDVSSKNLTVDMLRNNVYGLNADDYSVLKLNLNNYRILNPVTKNKEDFLYIPILHTNILDDNQIYVSKSQKTTANLLRLLSMRENFESLDGTSFDNYDKLEEAIENAYADLFNSFSHEYSNKKGILNDALMSGRVDLSGMSLSVGIIPAEFKDKEKTQMYSKLGKKMITMEGKKPKYESVVFASEDYLKSMGVNFDDIGKQLIDNDFMGNEKLKKMLLSDGYLDMYGQLIKDKIDDNANDFIGRYYAKNIGIDAIVTREPNFHPGSTLGAKVKLEDTLHGYTVMLAPWLAGPHNADIDGDNEFVQLIGLTKSGDKVLLRDKDDITSKAIKEALELQSGLNEEYVKEHGNLIKLEYDKNGKFTGKYEYIDPDDALKFTTTPEGMIEIIKKDFPNMGDNMNFFSDKHREMFEQLAIKARQNKGNIGYISNENFKIREMAFSLLESNKYNVYDYNKIIDFTTFTEQKIIDVKHAKATSLTVAAKYSEGLRLMGKGDTTENFEKGFSYLVQAIRDSKMYKDPVATVEEILNQTYAKNDPNEHLRAIYELFSNNEARDIYSAKAFNQGLNILNSTNKEKSIEYTKELLKEIANGTSNEELLNKSVRYNNELVRKASKSNIIVMNNKIISKGDIIGSNTTDDVFEVVKINNFKSNALIKDLKTDEIISLLGTDEMTLDEIFSKNYKSFVGAQKYEALNRIENAKRKITFDTLFENSDDVINAIHASYIENHIAKNNNKKTASKLRAIYMGENKLNNKDISYIEYLNKRSSGEIFEKLKNMDESDINLLKFTYETLQERYKEKKIPKSEVDVLLKKMNDEIISKAANAMQKRNTIKEMIDREVSNIAFLYSSKTSYDGIEEKFKSLKSYDITSMKKKYNKVLANAEKKFTSDLGFKPFVEDVILDSRKLANENISKAQKYNIKVGKKKTEILAESYDFIDVREDFLGWNNTTKTTVENIVNGRYGTVGKKDFKALANSRVGFGEYAEYRLLDLDLDVLNKLTMEQFENADTNVKKLMKESQKNINAYINYLVNGNKNVTNQYKNIKIDITKMAKPLENEFAVESLNKMILELAEQKRASVKEAIKETTEKVTDSTKLMEKVSKNKFLIGAGVAAASIAALNFLAGDTTVKQGKVSVNTPMPEQDQANEKPKIYSAPPSNNVSNKTFMQGVTMDIKARLKERADKKQVIDTVSSTFRSTIGNRVDIHAREESDRDEINDTWIKKKISRLLS